MNIASDVIFDNQKNYNCNNLPETFIPYKKFKTIYVIPEALQEAPNILINRTGKDLWMVLAKHAGKDGECYPSDACLAREMGLSERTIRYNVKKLVDAGFIIKDNSSKKEKYKFIMHDIFKDKDNQEQNLVNEQEEVSLDNNTLFWASILNICCQFFANLGNNNNENLAKNCQEVGKKLPTPYNEEKGKLKESSSTPKPDQKLKITQPEKNDDDKKINNKKQLDTEQQQIIQKWENNFETNFENTEPHFVEAARVMNQKYDQGWRIDNIYAIPDYLKKTAESVQERLIQEKQEQNDLVKKQAETQHQEAEQERLEAERTARIEQEERRKEALLNGLNPDEYARLKRLARKELPSSLKYKTFLIKRAMLDMVERFVGSLKEFNGQPGEINLCAI